ncbi:MAG: preprotein translocase subunit SecG [Ignavibacteria bacterium]|jgi:preprotein translocase subunit SecG|nr:preprotein translocase subunit SecG [Ignavibacteria bacterium]
MYIFLTIILVIIAVLIILVVLIQPGKGDMVSGMGTIGGSITSMFGTRRTADLLTKITVGLAVAMFLIVMLTNKFFIGGTDGVVIERAITEGAAIPIQSSPVQNAPAPQQQQPQQENPEQK